MEPLPVRLIADFYIFHPGMPITPLLHRNDQVQPAICRIDRSPVAICLLGVMFLLLDQNRCLRFVNYTEIGNGRQVQCRQDEVIIQETKKSVSTTTLSKFVLQK